MMICSRGSDVEKAALHPNPKYKINFRPLNSFIFPFFFFTFNYLKGVWISQLLDPLIFNTCTVTEVTVPKKSTKR